MGDSQVVGRIGVQREAKLKVLQFSRNALSCAKPDMRMISRKDLLDEVNAQSQVMGFPKSPARQSSATLTDQRLKARDIRKVDPAFATRLEPAILVRSGCIILSLGRVSADAFSRKRARHCAHFLSYSP